MKKVHFTEAEKIVVQYDKDNFQNDKDNFQKKIRDELSQRLIGYYIRKLNSNKINHSQLVDYISLVFKKAIGSSLSQSDLRKINSKMIKFDFLPYADRDTTDRMIHEIAYVFVGLCNGDKELVQRYILPKRILWNDISCRTDLDREETRALCKDVGEFTRKCVTALLDEFQDTGRIMTSEELVPTVTDRGDNCSNYNFEEESNDNTKTSADNINNQDVSQRSISLQESQEENDKSKSTTTKKGTNSSDTNSLHNLVLQKFLSWINELPEWLQKQILNSSAVRAVIESIEQERKIYDKKVDLDIYVQDQISSEEESLSYIDNAIDQKVAVSELSVSELVDTSMILDGNYVSSLILPISGEQAINFNGLNFNDFVIF